MWELHPDDSQETHTRRIEMASAMNVLMQGVAFMQIGQEFLRTKLYPTGNNGQLTSSDKQLAMNSYNAPDRVNQIDWDNVTEHHATIAFMRGIIHLKRTNPAFSYQSYKEIRDHVYVHVANDYDGIVVFDILGEKNYRIIFNENEKNLENYMTDVSKYAIIITNIKRLHYKNDKLEALSVSIFEIEK